MAPCGGHVRRDWATRTGPTGDPLLRGCLPYVTSTSAWFQAIIPAYTGQLQWRAASACRRSWRAYCSDPEDAGHNTVSSEPSLHILPLAVQLRQCQQPLGQVVGLLGLGWGSGAKGF